MNITNNYKLPQCLVDLVKSEQHKSIPNRYSVTQIIGNIRELILINRHYDEIDLDVSDCVNTIFGSAVHELIEKFDKTGFAEYKLEVLVNQFTLVGKVDLYDEKTHTIIDWKTASSWKIKNQKFDDYKLQGLIYAWMMLKKGYIVDNLKFHIFVKDWNKSLNFPQLYTWEYKVTTSDLIIIEKFIYNKFAQIQTSLLMSDNTLPICEDTWYSGDKYAVYTNNNLRANRVFDSENEAHDYIINKCGGVGRIEVRKGTHKKCQEFCNCKYFCKFWKEREVE